MAAMTRASRHRDRRDAAWPGTTAPFHVTTGNGSVGSGPRIGPAGSSAAMTAVISAAARAGLATGEGFGAGGGGANTTVFSAAAGAGFKAVSRAATKSRQRSQRAAGSFDMPRMITASTLGVSL